MRLFKIHPLLKLVNSYVVDSPQPSNLSYWWNFGSLLAFSLIIQIITGVTLAMHYNADILEAFNSVEHIMRDINNGWLVRYLHSNTASAFFFIVYLHIGRGLYYGSFKAPRMLTWIIGTIILVLMMGTAFLGYVLPFGQMSLWGATVITSLMSAIPWVGQDIVEFIWGGFSVNYATLNRFFALHFVLPFILAALALMHLIALHDRGGSGNPLGVSGNSDRLPFAPYFIFKDLITIFIFILVLSIFVFYMPNILGDSENYVMANPMQTPSAIVPEWYLLAFYAVLRSIPNKLLGVIAMLSAILMLLTTSFSDLTKLRGIQFRPLSKTIFFIFTANFLILTQLGAQHVELPFIEYGQISTVVYFTYFFIVIPYICLFEGSLNVLSSYNNILNNIYNNFLKYKEIFGKQFAYTPNEVVVESCFPGIPNSVRTYFRHRVSQLFTNPKESDINNINTNFNSKFNFAKNHDDLAPFDPNSGQQPIIDLARFTNNELDNLDNMLARLPDVGKYGIDQADALQYHLPNLFQIWYNYRSSGLFSQQEDEVMYRIAHQMLDYHRAINPSLPNDFSSIKPERNTPEFYEAFKEFVQSTSDRPNMPEIEFQGTSNNTGIIQQAFEAVGGRFPQSDSDTVRPWDIYFQHNYTSFLESLEFLHNDIIFYLVIVLFAGASILLSWASWLWSPMINKCRKFLLNTNTFPSPFITIESNILQSYNIFKSKHCNNSSFKSFHTSSKLYAQPRDPEITRIGDEINTSSTEYYHAVNMQTKSNNLIKHCEGKEDDFDGADDIKRLEAENLSEKADIKQSSIIRDLKDQYAELNQITNLHADPQNEAINTAIDMSELSREKNNREEQELEAKNLNYEAKHEYLYNKLTNSKNDANTFLQSAQKELYYDGEPVTYQTETETTTNVMTEDSNSQSNEDNQSQENNADLPESNSDAPRPWGFYFQDSGTPQMEALVELHDNIMYYLIIILFGVGCLLWTIIKKYGDMRSPLSQRFSSHGTSIEVIWTLTPGIILLLIAFPSYKLLYLMDEISDPMLVVFMQGYQWYWNSQYIDFIKDDETVEFDSYLVPEPDLQNGALRMLEVDNRIVIPELTHTRFVVGGGDVIHSFACPSLGLKCDAYPGRLNQSSLMVNRMSTFYGQCSEICGILHSSMPIVIQAVSTEKFVKWVLGQ